jgi:ParB-like chromosome segregation protein Spo0J
MPTQDIPLADLKGHERNYNAHSDAQIARIARSLSTFGQVRSIVTRQNTILAGHGVVLAARSLGWETIRADVQDQLSEAQALAYVVADNELARQSDPDQAQLAAILEELQAKEPLLVEAAGYTSMELEQLLRLVNPKPAVDAEPQIDRAAELQVKWSTSTGQLWGLGKHTICPKCGKRHDL